MRVLLPSRDVSVIHPRAVNTPGGVMAKQTVLVSDLTGRAIGDGAAVKIRLTFEDARRGSYELDASVDEVADLMAKGRKVARRGRRPKEAK
jgi:hypothetical protein